MPETNSGENFFLHIFRSINKLRGLKGETAVSTDMVLNAMHEDQQKTLDEIIASLEANTQSSPAVIMQKAFENLSKVDEKRFVVQNLLEALKRGDDPVVTLKRYKELGLISVNIDPNNDLGRQPNQSMPTPSWGSFFVGLGKKLDKIALVLMEIIVHAIKAIPMFIGVKPSIGMVGLVPSLYLTLEGEALTLSDLFDVLRISI